MSVARTNPKIRDADPKGRIDVAILRMGQEVAKRCGPKGEAVWNGGLGDVVEEIIVNAGVPSKPFTAVDLAREIGILPKGARR